MLKMFYNKKTLKGTLYIQHNPSMRYKTKEIIIYKLHRLKVKTVLKLAEIIKY